MKIEILKSVVEQYWNLNISQLVELNLGADPNAQTFSAVNGQQKLFIKTRTANTPVSNPITNWLWEQGIKEVISALNDNQGLPQQLIHNHYVSVYPFVSGKNGYEQPTTKSHWKQLGKAISQLHQLNPDSCPIKIKELGFSDFYPKKLENILNTLDDLVLKNNIEKKLINLFKKHKNLLTVMIQDCLTLSNYYQEKNPQTVLCHSDLHAGNLLFNDDQQLFIVDWDELKLAPKEKDLMFPGGAQGYQGLSPEEEVACFFSTYNDEDIDHQLIKYYRTARIIEDLAIDSEQILIKKYEENSEQTLTYIENNFKSEGTIERAGYSLVIES